MFKMNKAAGKKGVKLCAALLTAVIMITGCSSGSGGERWKLGFHRRSLYRRPGKTSLAAR